MGFFNNFKNSDKQNEGDIINNKQEVGRLSTNVANRILSNGNLQLEFYDESADFKKFYDTTRLIIGKQPLNIEGHKVYNCAVSWYGRNDFLVRNEQTGKFESKKAQEYRSILAEISIELLLSDQDYYKMVMENLLNKQKVEKYLETALQEEPEQPCGKYVGGVRKTEEGYIEFFSKIVGRASHNSEQMKSKRKKYKEMNEAPIDKLPNGLDDIEKYR